MMYLVSFNYDTGIICNKESHEVFLYVFSFCISYRFILFMN